MLEVILINKSLIQQMLCVALCANGTQKPPNEVYDWLSMAMAFLE